MIPIDNTVKQRLKNAKVIAKKECIRNAINTAKGLKEICNIEDEHLSYVEQNWN